MLTFLFVLFFGAFIAFVAAAVAVTWHMTMFVVTAVRLTLGLVGSILGAALRER